MRDESLIDPSLPFSPDHQDDEVDAFKFREDVEATGHALQGYICSRAKRNERWLHGEQFDSADEVDDGSSAITKWDEYTPKHHRNLLRVKSQTWLARALDDRRRMRAFPVESAGGDVYLAEVCNRLMEHQDNKVDRAAFWYDVAQSALTDTCCATFTYFDPDSGPLSPGYLIVDDITGEPMQDEDGGWLEDGGGQPMGEVITERTTVHEYWTDGNEDIARSYWLARRMYRPKHEALELLLDAGYERDEAVEKLETNSGKASRKAEEGSAGGPLDFTGNQVALLEIWHVPCARFPEGFRLLFVGDCLVANDPYPYKHRMLPQAVLKIMKRSGSPYGSTHFDDAIPVQRAYNEAVSIALRHAVESRSTWMVTTHGVANQMKKKGNYQIRVSPEELKSDLIKYYQAPGPLETIENIRAQSQAEMDVVFGLHEILEGEGIDQGVANVTLQTVNSLSAMKLAQFKESLTTAQKRVYLQELSLMQQHYGSDRLTAIVGDDLAWAVPLFLESTLETMIDMRLDAVAGSTNDRAAAVDSALVATAEGRMDPARGAELAQTGASSTAAETVSRQLVQQMVQTVAQGGEAQDDPRVDPAIAVQELSRFYGMYERDPAVSQAILEMLAFYRSMLQGPPGGAPAGPSTPGPAGPTGGISVEEGTL